MLRHKYNAVKDEHDGIKFDSKAEGRYYLYLKAQVAAGEVVNFAPHVSFWLPGGTRYVVDFLVWMTDGRTRFIDVKGVETVVFKNKKKLFEATYAPAVIEVVK